MGHHSCCNKQKVRRGLWSPEEDEKLVKYVTTHGHGCWSSVPKQAGLQRCGKSCRLRWINYLRPDLKRGCFSLQEERLIIELHRILGNRWAQIAKHLPGRTDNEVKNFWNSCIKKKLLAQGMDINTHQLINKSSSMTQSLSTENLLDGHGGISFMGGHVSGSTYDPLLMNADMREIASGSGLSPAENVGISSYSLPPDMISKRWPYDNQISMARNSDGFGSKFVQPEHTSTPSMTLFNIKDFRRLEPKQFLAQYNPTTDFRQLGVDLTAPIYEVAMNHQLGTPIVVQNDCGLINPCCPAQLPNLCEMGHAEECNSSGQETNDIHFFTSPNYESYGHFDIDLLDSSLVDSECISHPVTEWN